MLLFQGIEETRAAWLISIIGIVNTAARLLFGFISDIPSISSFHLHNACIIMTGVAVFIVPFCPSFAILTCASVTFSIFAGKLNSFGYSLLINLT